MATDTKPLALRVSNFGPIAEAEIDLRPLTVFVGPSNTGKSYLAILIYALHRFFSSYFGYFSGRHFGLTPRDYPLFYRGRWAKEQDISDEDVRKLIAWIDTVAKNPSDNSRVQLPDFVASWVHLTIKQMEDFNKIIAEEVGRSFGVEDTRQLIRHGKNHDARIVLQHIAEDSDSFKPFEYELALKGKQSELVVSTSKEHPLHIDQPRISDQRFPVFPFGIFASQTRYAELEGEEEKREIAAMIIDQISKLVVFSTIGPLARAAHYLPADRTGVMHAHRVVVASLIQRAPRGGLMRDTPLPALSGVLADFLEQLVGLGDLSDRRQHVRDGNLAGRLEKQILKGKIRKEDSETGYPIFSYQPEGCKKDIPLMNASSMVSELAPVVLYLRHVVQAGDVLIIEEPESHLHPEMQVEFIRQLAAVVRSGVRVMLTTHSEWVLEELANLVLLSELPKAQRRDIAGADFALRRDEVGAWLFEPKQRPKGSVVKEIPLDAEFGGFQSGFGLVTESLYNRWANIFSRTEEG